MARMPPRPRVSSRLSVFFIVLVFMGLFCLLSIGVIGKKREAAFEQLDEVVGKSELKMTPLDEANIYVKPAPVIIKPRLPREEKPTFSSTVPSEKSETVPAEANPPRPDTSSEPPVMPVVPPISVRSPAPSRPHPPPPVRPPGHPAGVARRPVPVITPPQPPQLPPLPPGPPVPSVAPPLPFLPPGVSESRGVPAVPAVPPTDMLSLLPPVVATPGKKLKGPSEKELLNRILYACPAKPRASLALATPPQVDFLYLWVDGSDPVRDAKFQAFAPPVRGKRRDEKRYANHDELMYSLRSQEMFAPWVRRVHVISDNQRPAWLVDGHPRIGFISHEEAFAHFVDNASDVSGLAEMLPTFNPFAIEANMLYGQDLAQKVVAFNDDMFVGREMTEFDLVPADGSHLLFFELGLLVTTRDRKPRRWNDNNVGEWDALYTSNEILDRRFGIASRAYVSHVPRVYDRRLFMEVAAEFSTELRETSRHRFRTVNDVHLAFLYGHFIVERFKEELFFALAESDEVDRNGDRVIDADELAALVPLLSPKCPFIGQLLARGVDKLDVTNLRAAVKADGWWGQLNTWKRALTECYSEWKVLDDEGPWDDYRWTVANLTLSFVNVRMPLWSHAQSLNTLATRRPVLFCINDDEDFDRVSVDKTIRGALSNYFPLPSSYENGVPPPRPPQPLGDMPSPS